MSKFKWLPPLLLAINIAFGLLLILSLFSVYVSPLNYWWPSIAGLTYLQIMAVNGFFFFFWLFFRRRFSLVSIVFLILGLTELPKHIQLNISSSPWNKEMKILSLNVRNFDLYNWTSNKKTRDKILHIIKSNNAEIICLQEFFNTTNPGHDFKTLDTILEFDNHYNSHVEYTATAKKTEHWGIATFTTYPVVGKGVIHFEENSNNIAIYTDVNIGWKTYRIYNLHLASVRFRKEDYTYLEGVVDRNLDPNVSESKTLIMKLKNAFERRANQVKLVREHMDKSPYPIILCGDFNDTPTSYAYYQLSKGLNDSFKMKGNGFGSTYNGKLPYLRIDYIFTDPSFEVLKHEIIHSDISDHYPICASVEIRD